MNIDVMQANADEASKLLKTLANTSRLLVLCALVTREYTAGELEELSGLSQPAVSQHLSRLREERIVSTRREAQRIFYSLSNPEVHAVLETLHRLYCSD
jgi:DNA-binding transcriptional ArsR family regulator